MSPSVSPSPRDLRCASLSIVVPAYNEAGNLPRLMQTLQALRPSLAARTEVIVVDDGSRDGTPQAMAPWVAQPGVVYRRLSRNFGKEAALSAGLERARGDAVVMLDADGQHPPELIAPMLARWAAGVDMVVAVRASRERETWLKRQGTRWFYRIVNAGSSVPIPPDTGDFRLLDRRVRDALVALPERNRFMKGLYAWVGFRTELMPYTPGERQQGRSRFSLGRLAALAITGVTSFSTLPLRLWSGLGALLAFAALGYGAWIVVEHLMYGHPIPGWPTLVAGLMFFGGVQLLSIGILGEYIGRIFDEVKQRPLYLVDVEAGQGLEADA